ncbi:MAG: tRNA (adenosine(37)-N6)-dimethylallyltransferase MiaA [Thermoanaerobaculia bacterium]|nr:tRNA (adenosine(37)-N6)-dimethylallyltransferase MiaA [Thermoanaerobaculia bacterium]
MITVLAIVGPTAVGKSALAMDLAGQLQGEIINADALQVYRGLDIGTAKPTLEERRRVRHHLVDILDPSEPYSAAEFARLANIAIREISSRGRLPIVVGGSGLYIRSLFQGMSPIPTVDPAIREWQNQRHRSEGLAPSRRELRILDPALAARLEAGDTQRILRGVEVALGTGKPLSWWQTLERVKEQPLREVVVGLTLPRAILYDRVAERVYGMLEMGWLQEVENLLTSGLNTKVPAFQAIGYRQLTRCVVEGWSVDEAAKEIILATRRFAKRQLTWFRSQPNIHWISDRVLASDRVRVIELI